MWHSALICGPSAFFLRNIKFLSLKGKYTMGFDETYVVIFNGYIVMIELLINSCVSFWISFVSSGFFPQTIFFIGFSRAWKWTKYDENNIKQGVDFFMDCLLNILPPRLVPCMQFSIFKDLDCENHCSFPLPQWRIEQLKWTVVLRLPSSFYPVSSGNKPSVFWVYSSLFSTSTLLLLLVDFFFFFFV